MKPKKGKYYYINYVDLDPAGSFDGIAECVNEYLYDNKGAKLEEPLYEFLHRDNKGTMVYSLFNEKEVLLEA
jgi:hypothetical protein